MTVSFGAWESYLTLLFVEPWTFCNACSAHENRQVPTEAKYDPVAAGPNTGFERTPVAF